MYVEDLSAGKSIAISVKDGNMEGTLAGSVSDYSITTTVRQGHSNVPESSEEGPIALELTAENGDINLQFGDSGD